MSERAEVERLVLEAADLPGNVHELTGRLGHRASLEPSAHGKARKISVSRDGVPLHWSFSLECEEARPGFYPANVPFLGDLASVLSWDNEAGLNVKWLASGFKDRMSELVARVKERGLAEIPEAVTALAGRMESASREERRQLFTGLDVAEGSPVATWAIDLFGEPSSGDLPEEATRALKRILASHAESGWTVTEKESSGVQRRYQMTKGSSVRGLHAISILGLTTIDLHERP